MPQQTTSRIRLPGTNFKISRNGTVTRLNPQNYCMIRIGNPKLNRYCAAISNSDEDFILHHNKVHNRQFAKCQFCQDGLIYTKLLKHWRSCVSFKQFKEKNRQRKVLLCEYPVKNVHSMVKLCGHQFRSKKDFIHHCRNQHDLEYLACGECPSTPIVLYVRVHHRKLHSPIVNCPIGKTCKFVSSSASHLGRHVRQKHAKWSGLEEIPGEPSPHSIGTSDLNINEIFTNLPPHYKTMQNDFFQIVFDEKHNRTVLSVSVYKKSKLKPKKQFKKGRINFVHDEKLPLIQQNNAVARKFGCHAGHLEACAQHNNSMKAFKSTFLNRNLVYMYAGTNQRPWRQLENHKTFLTNTSDYVISINGVIYDDERNPPQVTLGGLEASLPTHFFSILNITKGKSTTAQVFLVENSRDPPKGLTIFHHRSTFHEVELLTGLVLSTRYKMKYTWPDPICQQDNKYNRSEPNRKNIVPVKANFSRTVLKHTVFKIPKVCKEKIKSSLDGSLCMHRYTKDVREFILHNLRTHSIVYYPCDLCYPTSCVRRLTTHHNYVHNSYNKCPLSSSCSFLSCNTHHSSIIHIRQCHGAHIGYISWSERSEITPPTLKTLRLSIFFQNVPTHYQHVGGKYIWNIIDTENQRTVMSISVLKTDETCNKIKRKPFSKFKYSLSLPLVQVTSLATQELHCEAAHLESANLHQYSTAAYQSTFSNANLTFMEKELNVGPWKALDHHKTNLLEHCDYIICINGVLYDDERNKPKTLTGGVVASTPEKFFSVIFIYRGNEEPRCQLYVINNINDYSNQCVFDYIVSYKEFEDITKLTFRPEYLVKLSWELDDSEIHKCDRFDCGIFFKTQEELATHCKQGHKKSVPTNTQKVQTHKYICDYCNAGFDINWKLKRHRPDPNGRKCHICEQTFCNQTQLRDHADKYHQNVHKIWCLICIGVMSGRGNYDEHLKAHLEKIRKIRSGEIKLDLTISYSDRQCTKCGVVFSLKGDLDCHLRKNVNCKLCTLVFCTQKILNAHVKFDHKKSLCKNVLIANYSVCVTRICRRCNKHFTRALSYKNHRKNVKTCPKCDGTFCSVRLLKEHIKLVHSNEGCVKMCKLCSTLLFDENEYKNHMQYHLDIVKKLKENAMQDELLTTGTGKYPCKKCGHRFTTLENLQKHLIKTYTCDFDDCKETFCSYNLLVWHKGLDHSSCNQ